MTVNKLVKIIIQVDIQMHYIFTHYEIKYNENVEIIIYSKNMYVHNVFNNF